MKNIDIATVIANTINLEPAHLEQCCRNRADNASAEGSFYRDASPEDVKEALLSVDWEPYTHSSIASPAVGFIAPKWAGVMNIAKLSDMERGTPVVLRDAHHGNALDDDHYVEADVTHDGGGLNVDFTVALVGPRSREDATPILWTFFPGDPVRPSQISATGNHGRVIDASDATGLGMEWAKCVRPTRSVFTALVLDVISIKKLRALNGTPDGMTEKGTYVLLREGHAHSLKRDGVAPAFELGSEHSLIAHELGFGDNISAARVVLPPALEEAAKRTSKIFASPGHVTMWHAPDVKPAKSKEIEVWKSVEPVRLTGRIMELPSG